jgi:hypothetical protein
MATTTRAQHPALVVMDPRLDAVVAPWAAHSSYTEASPRAGIPEPAGAYQGSLRAKGEQTAAFTARVQSAGLPSSQSTAATFATSPDGSTGWAGWEGPGSVAFWDAASYSASTADYLTQPHVCATPTGALLACARKGTGTGSLVVYRKAAGATSWGSEISVSTRGLAPYGPCLVMVGDRVMLFVAVESPTGSVAYVWSLYSDDDGATWTEAAAPAGVDSTTVQGVTANTVRRTRAAYANGQIILFLHTRSGTTNTVYQWASDDLGCSFSRVSTLSGEGGVDVVAVGGQFLAVFGAFAAGAYSTKVRRYGSAFQSSASSVIATLGSSTGLGSAYLTDTGAGTVSRHNGFGLAVDEVGTVYVFASQYSPDPDTKIYRGQVFASEDLGVTWIPWGQDVQSANDPSGYSYSARWVSPNNGDTGVTPEAVFAHSLAACAHRGRFVVAHNWNAPTATYGNSLGFAYLGGLTTQCLPPINRGARYQDQASWDWTWLPYEEPSAIPNSVTWTETGTASSTLSAPGRLNLSAPLASTAYGTFNDPIVAEPSARDTTGDTLICEVAVEAVTNPDTTTERIALRCRVDDGVYGYEVSVRVNTVAVVVYDNVSNTQIMASAALATGPKHVRVGLDGSTGAVAVWVRGWADAEIREWTLLDTATLTDDGGTVGNHRIQFGSFSGVVGAVTSRWFFVAVSFGDRAGYSNVGTQAHWDAFDPAYLPDILKGRQIPAAPRFAYARSGAALSGLRGPYLTGQTWAVTPDAVFSAARVLPQVARSPRLGWRSTGDNVQQTIALQLQSTGADSAPTAPVMALILRGINWRTGSIQARVGGTWTTQATIDAAISSTAIGFTRTGDVLTPSTYDAARPYFATGELTGWTAQFGNISGGILIAQRKIRHNTEGKLSTGTYGGPVCRLTLTGVAGTEQTSGTMRLWSPEIAVVFPFTANADGWRILIDAQQTADDYYTIGQMVLGPLHLFAQPYSWGRTQTTERGSVVEVQPDRSTYLARPAPARRVIQMTWADGVDETQLWAASPEPDYPDYDSGDASNANAATLHSLTGLLNEADGRMVALLPKVTLPITTTQTIHRRAGLIVGTASATDSLDTIQGEELTDEVHRSGNLVVTEEV